MTQEADTPTVGAIFERWWPFHLIKESRRAPDGSPLTDGFWCAGWETESGGDYGEDAIQTWNGEGAQVRTVISIHKPGPTFAPRIFYVRQWRNPEGEIIGKRRLFVETEGAFRRFLSGATLHFLAEARGEQDLIATIWAESEAA